MSETVVSQGWSRACRGPARNQGHYNRIVQGFKFWAMIGGAVGCTVAVASGLAWSGAFVTVVVVYVVAVLLMSQLVQLRPDRGERPARWSVPNRRLNR